MIEKATPSFLGDESLSRCFPPCTTGARARSFEATARRYLGSGLGVLALDTSDNVVGGHLAGLLRREDVIGVDIDTVEYTSQGEIVFAKARPPNEILTVSACRLQNTEPYITPLTDRELADGRLADDIAIFATSHNKLQQMIQDIHRKCKKVELQLNYNMTYNKRQQVANGQGWIKIGRSGSKKLRKIGDKEGVGGRAVEEELEEKKRREKLGIIGEGAEGLGAKKLRKRKGVREMQSQGEAGLQQPKVLLRDASGMVDCAHLKLPPESSSGAAQERVPFTDAAASSRPAKPRSKRAHPYRTAGRRTLKSVKRLPAFRAGICRANAPAHPPRKKGKRNVCHAPWATTDFPNSVSTPTIKVVFRNIGIVEPGRDRQGTLSTGSAHREAAQREALKVHEATANSFTEPVAPSPHEAHSQNQDGRPRASAPPASVAQDRDRALPLRRPHGPPSSNTMECSEELYALYTNDMTPSCSTEATEDEQLVE
ncbi:Uncharacterized protein GBIM_19339 [Gryllus bimaculatus]|nr:Uncharacterized protein GBIM_19339 [Gryllus bimaculatus]